MKTNKGGFTLIEVSLFLAITGLLFLGVTIGVQNSIFQQRYNDSVQSFVEFLRSAYSKVENVQGTSGENSGKTNQALYGKLITFGEKTTLTGESNTDDKVFMYDVIGKAKCDTGGFKDAIRTLMEDCGADVIDDKKQLLGLAESYTPKWSAVIQNTNKNKAELFEGALLITRHPQTGSINTYLLSNETIQVNQGRKLFQDPAVVNRFSNSTDVDFCINPNGNEISQTRADVRIRGGARNASSIDIMPDDENRCNRS